MANGDINQAARSGGVMTQAAVNALRPDRPEANEQRAIVRALESVGAWVIRVQSGGQIRVRRGRMQLAEAGTPDLHIVGLGWLEVKSATGKLTTEQRAWHQRAANLGVRVAVVQSTREAMETYLAWKADGP
jgi:hypothetical protein